MQSPPVSLRERQRLETWAAIHDAAAESVIRDGWSATTVERIATAAGISNRTFFNYFASKEDAVLGIQQQVVPDDALAAFEAGEGDLFERTVQLMMAVIRSSTPAAVRLERRKQLVRSVPELRSKAMEVAGSAEKLIEPILVQTLAEESGSITGTAPEEDRIAAQALMMLAGTAIRFAFQQDPEAMSGPEGEAALAASASEFRKAISRTL